MPAQKVKVVLSHPVTVTLPAGLALRVNPTILLQALGEDSDDPPPAPAPDPQPQGQATPSWLVDVNPRRPFGQSQGRIPAGNGAKSGEPNLVAAQCEATVGDTGSDEPVAQIRLFEEGPRVTADAVEFTPGVNWIERVQDPLGSGAPVYKHRLNKQAANYTPGGDSIRAEVGGTGDLRYSPWGTPEICVASVSLPDQWGDPDQAADGEWNVVFQWHDAPGGLTHNPPAAVYLRAGADPKFVFTLRKYRDGLTPPEFGNKAVAGGSIPATLNKRHYFVAHYAADAGGKWSGRTPGFFDLWHAEGDEPLKRVVEYAGQWGSPNPQADDKPGFWKTGLYTGTKFRGSDDRVVFTQGFRQYVVGDSGLTPAQALTDFKKSR